MRDGLRYQTHQTNGNINNPMKFTKIIKKALGNVNSARFLSNNCALIFCVNRKQQENALKIKELGGAAVKCHVQYLANLIILKE